MADEKSDSKQKEEKKEENCIFSKENVNMNHQREIDYAKTIGILLFGLIHVYNHYSKGNFSRIIYFIGLILGAGGFMLHMGIGIKYSRHHELKNYISRGIILLTMGQYVYLLRHAVPNLFAWWKTGNKVFISRVLLVFQTDIFTFAGFSFLFLSLLKKMKLSDKFIMIIGIIMNGCALLINRTTKSPNNFLLSQFLGYFVFTNTESLFPLSSYFIFVACGYWLGGIYQKISNKDKFYNLILIFCLPSTTIYYYLRSHYDFPILPQYWSDESYCLNSGPDAIFSCITNIIAFAIYYKIDKIVKGKTPEFIIHCGKYFTQYYIISYIFTMQMNTFLRATRGEKYANEIGFPTLLAFMILIFTRILIDINNKYIHFTIINLKNPMRNFVFALIWIMTIIVVSYTYPKVEVYSTMWNNYLYDE